METVLVLVLRTPISLLYYTQLPPLSPPRINSAICDEQT